jgi:peptidoglycan/xylan/chitin deacetylase (PgdA/CDA1 family)
METSGTVIVYHGVGSSPPDRDPYHMLMPIEAFEWQMAFLARKRRVVPLEAILSGSESPGRPAVAITFDDGYRSFLTTAAPVLRRYDFPATLFVPTGWIGDSMRWEPQPANAVNLDIMTAEEIRSCQAMGYEIASHGHAHAHMAALAPEVAQADVAESMSRLTAILGHQPRYLAYPWGEHSATVRGAVERAGFEAAFSINQVDAGQFGRERVAIRRSDPRLVFEAKTSGRYLRARMWFVPRLTLRLMLPALDWYRRQR